MKLSLNNAACAILASTALLTACAANTTASENETPTTEEALSQIEPTGLSRRALKAAVVRIASENTTKSDAESLIAARKKLNPLIADLARSYRTPAVAAELDRGFAGTWKQIWSDDYRPAPPGAPIPDPSSVFQVITKNGYFYNFGNQVIPTPPGAPRVVVGGFLRGEYTAAPGAHILDIKFTRFGVLPGALPDGAAIGVLALDIERGAVGGPGAASRADTGLQGDAGAPGRGGPVGVTGRLQNLYLDGDLRIALGGTKEQQFNKVFVLTRVNP